MSQTASHITGVKKKILLIKSLLCYFLLLWLGGVFSSGSLKIGEGKSTLVKIEFLYLLIRAEIKVFSLELWAL